MVDTVCCDIDIRGQWYNHWPQLRIFNNQQLIWSGIVTEQCSLTFVLTAQEKNCLRFEHWGKFFGENNQWDTAADGVQDCKLQITDIRFNDVSIGHKIRGKLSMISHPTASQQQDADWMNQFAVISYCDGWMTFNGIIDLLWEMPVYNWLIVNKFRIDDTGDQAYFSDYSTRWNYDPDIQLIAEIKNLMKFDEDSSTSHSKS